MKKYLIASLLILLSSINAYAEGIVASNPTTWTACRATATYAIYGGGYTSPDQACASRDKTLGSYVGFLASQSASGSTCQISGPMEGFYCSDFNTRAYRKFSCPTNSTVGTATGQATCTCNAGYQPSNGQCVLSPPPTCGINETLTTTTPQTCQCATGSTRNSTTNLCEFPPATCTPPQTLHTNANGVQYCAQDCTAPQTWDVLSQSCAGGCPADYSWNASLQACEITPTGNPTGGGGTTQSGTETGGGTTQSGTQTGGGTTSGGGTTGGGTTGGGTTGGTTGGGTTGGDNTGDGTGSNIDLERTNELLEQIENNTNCDGCILPQAETAQQAAEVAAEIQKTTDALSDINEDYDLFKQMGWADFIPTFPTSSCTPSTNNIKGISFTWNFCPYIKMISDTIGWLWALFGAWTITSTFFRKGD